MCKYCEYNDNYEWLMSISMGKANPYLDLMTRTRINPTTNKLSLSVATESDGEDQIIVDMPINYCPVCGRNMSGKDEVTDQLLSDITSALESILRNGTRREAGKSDGYKPEKQENAQPNKPEKPKKPDADEKQRIQTDWLLQKKNSAKINIDGASKDWDAFFDMAVQDVPIPDLPRLRVGLYNVGVRCLGNDPEKLSLMSDRQVANCLGVGKAYRPWVIKLRDFAKEVC